MRPLIALCFFCSVPAADLLAQRDVRDQSHAWVSWFGDYALTERWFLDADASYRMNGPADEMQTVLWRIGARFNLSPSIRLAAGYAGSENYPYGTFPVAHRFPEHRLWQDVRLLHTVDRVQVSHRYRFEERWSGQVTSEGEVDGWTRTNRVRYQFRATRPLGAPTIQVGTTYLQLTNELFVNFGSHVRLNVFDQNRMQVMVGRRVSEHLRLEAGYLQQLLLKANGAELERNHTLVTAFVTSFAR